MRADKTRQAERGEKQKALQQWVSKAYRVWGDLKVVGNDVVYKFACVKTLTLGII